MPTNPRHLALPIEYHHCVEAIYEFFAESCELAPAALRRATVLGLRTRLAEARIDHPGDRAHGRVPDIWTLTLDGFDLVFTIEPHAIVVRGYVSHVDNDITEVRCFLDNHW